MVLEDYKKTIKDPKILTQGYDCIDGYVFTSVTHPANVFDGILIRNPSCAKHLGDGFPCSLHSLIKHIDFINKKCKELFG